MKFEKLGPLSFCYGFTVAFIVLRIYTEWLDSKIKSASSVG